MVLLVVRVVVHQELMPHLILVILVAVQVQQLVVILVHLVMDLQDLVVLEMHGVAAEAAAVVLLAVMQDRLVLEPW